MGEAGFFGILTEDGLRDRDWGKVVIETGRQRGGDSLLLAFAGLRARDS